jgi:hypothetical protein
MAARDPGIDIVAASGGEGDDDTNGFAFVKGFLGVCISGDG